MALDPPAAASREHLEPAVERTGELREAHHRHACRGQLDREGYAVEAPTHLHHGIGVVGIEGEFGIGGTGALDEEPHRVGPRDRFEVGVSRGRVERRDRQDLLAIQRQPLAAGRQHHHARTGTLDRLHEIDDRLQDVLAVVDN